MSDFHDIPSLERPCYQEMKRFIDQEGASLKLFCGKQLQTGAVVDVWCDREIITLFGQYYFRLTAPPQLTWYTQYGWNRVRVVLYHLLCTETMGLNIGLYFVFPQKVSFLERKRAPHVESLSKFRCTLTRSKHQW